jgi:hypothetical protein
LFSALPNHYEIDADGVEVGIGEGVIAEASEDAGFAHPRVSYQQQLDELFGHCH